VLADLAGCLEGATGDGDEVGGMKMDAEPNPAANLQLFSQEIDFDAEEPKQEVETPASAPAPIPSEPAPENGKGEPEQIQLLHIPEWWEEHWKGMPEYVSKDLTPYKTIYVHFETREDRESFSQLVGPKIGINTQCIWYPEAEIGRMVDKRYVDSLGEQSSDLEVIDEQ
jgi:hypothetical protein